MKIIGKYQMIKIVIVIASLFVLIGCGTKKHNNESSQTIGDSLASVIDSIQLMNLNKSFVGIHAHGKDLAEHAHQNPKKKRRWRKKQAEGVAAKKIAAKKQSIRRQKIIDSLNSVSVE